MAGQRDANQRGTLLTICEFGLAEHTGPGVLGICERSEVEQRGLADEVLGPREADRAVGLAPMRESGLPSASLSTFSPHANVAPQLPAPPTVRGRMPQRK